VSKRILFVVDSLFPLGNAAYPLSLLADALVHDDFDVHVVSLDDVATQRHAMSAGVHVHDMRNRPNRDYLRPLRLRSLIGGLRPDIVHAWGFDAHPTALLATHRFPSVRTICTYVEIPPRRSQVVGRWLWNKIYADATLVVVHDTIADQLIDDGIEREFSVIASAVAPADVDREQIRSQFKQRLDIPDSATVVGSVARFEPRTKLKDLIWAADLLYCIRDDVHLVLIGRGSQRDRLHKFLWQTQVGPNVHFIDSLDSSGNYLSVDSVAAFDVYWHSHLTELASSALLLAMAHGVPVIGVAGPGTDQVILHQQTGMAVNFGARDEFARWTKYLMEQEQCGRLLADQAKEFIAQKFPVQQMVEDYVRLYQSATWHR
jgi:glycosyltransferase involved in cell wall biosynthesis